MVRITETVTSTSDVIKVYIIISYFLALYFYKISLCSLDTEDAMLG